MANNATTQERKVSFETPPISRLLLGRSPITNRKLSFPAALNANLLGLSNENGKEAPNTKRRLSNVSDAVSRKLSSTIGWRNIAAVPIQDVTSQGRLLCGQYIRDRLKRAGLFRKKAYLSQLRSAIGPSTSPIVSEVTPFLTAAGTELERMHPKLFTSISRQASLAPGGVLVSDKTAPSLLIAISHELLKCDITWGKVVSIFAIAGGLAVDCVFQGHSEYIHGLLDGMTDVLEDDLAEWVATNGGWTAFCAQCKYPEKETGLNNYVFVVLILIASLVLIYVVICFL